MLIRIVSPDNSRIRLVRKLATRKGRVTEGMFIAEGINLVSEAVSGGLDVEFIMVPEGYEESLSDDALALVRQCVESDDITVCEVPAKTFGSITDADNGIGVIAAVHMMQHDAGVLDSIPEGANILVLDRIQDPGNIGTMIRTAVAAGYGLVVAVKGTADIYSPKVLRATAGMIFNIPVIYAEDAGELEEILRASGRRIVVTDPARGKPYYEEDLSEGVALVIGNEGNGISEEVMSIADVRVNLPMKGNIESLNAAVAAAILMYETVRKKV